MLSNAIAKMRHGPLLRFTEFCGLPKCTPHARLKVDAGLVVHKMRSEERKAWDAWGVWLKDVQSARTSLNPKPQRM